jgi:hypothetical protein
MSSSTVIATETKKTFITKEILFPLLSGISLIFFGLLIAGVSLFAAWVIYVGMMLTAGGFMTSVEKILKALDK